MQWVGPFLFPCPLTLQIKVRILTGLFTRRKAGQLKTQNTPRWGVWVFTSSYNSTMRQSHPASLASVAKKDSTQTLTSI